MKRRRSNFHEIAVTDRGGVRTLSFGDTIQSTMRLDGERDEGLAYVELFHVPLVLRPDATRVLFIGLGGATGPKQFLADYDSMQVEVVEIDAAVIRVAAESFGFTASERATVHEADGLSFLEASHSRWDLIIVDAYGVEDEVLVIPRELTTRSFFKLCSRRLNPGGFVVFNCAAPHSDLLTREIEEALAKVFTTVATFGVGNANNSVLLATAGPFETRTTKLVDAAKAALKRGTVKRKAVVKYARELRRIRSRKE